MDQNQNTRLFELVATMTAPVSLTALQLADSLGTTRRNLYNYLHLLSDCGFRVVKEGTRYRLDTRSSFFRRLHENIALTDTEADYLCKRLADSASNDNMASLLRLKLVRQFGFSDIVATPGYARRISDAKAKLRNAMREERIVRIIDYSSPHSHTVSDRYVEPFMFLADTGDVRCHEISTHQNKTFKLSRMGGVEVLDDNWFNKKTTQTGLHRHLPILGRGTAHRDAESRTTLPQPDARGISAIRGSHVASWRGWPLDAHSQCGVLSRYRTLRNGTLRRYTNHWRRGFQTIHTS